MTPFLSVLQENPLLNALDVGGLEKIVAASKKVGYPRGRLIYRAGEELSRLSILFSGQVRIFRREAEGKGKVLAYLTKGDFFGQMPFIKQEPLSFSVDALMDSEVLEIEKGDLEKILKDHLHISEKAQQLGDQEGGEKYYHLIPKMATGSRPSVIVVYGTEDEIGKTTLAINLGVSLIRETKNSVVLLDLTIPEESPRPTATSVLRLDPLKYLSTSDLSMEDLDESLMVHHTQLRILALSPELLKEEAKAPKLVASLIKLLKESFDYVLIDTHSKPTRSIWEALALSEVILFVTSSIDNEVPAGVLSNQEMRLILNLGDEVSIRSTKKGSSHYLLERDYTTLEIFSRSGLPFVVQAPHRPISRTISRLARDLGGRRIGLALGGRGALGLAQIGVLEVLEHHKIPVDAILGSGLGSFVGAAYAAGAGIPQIKRFVLNWFSQGNYSQAWDLRLLKGRLLLGNSLMKLFRALLRDIEFGELSIPFKIITVDAKTGEVVLFQEDKVVDALQESLGLSSAFGPPRAFETASSEVSLNEVKAQHLKEMGADITLITNLVAPTEKDDSKVSLPAPPEPDPFTSRPPTFTLRLDLGKFSWRDFNRAQELIALGAETTLRHIPEIERTYWER